ncbi:DUF2877 domain-containing protein [Marinitenerispora sediminis]|uniref:DUF2877 domain-containing protein n=1 Tax=Marinitenerispora sediminis TaxID=1931232 RepID=UPI00131434AF|nr:DUF2877 domain-containing protein [Marinitenerispora sediminis]
MFRSAVYLEVEDPRRPAVIALLASDAVRLPNGIVLAEPQSAEPFACVAVSTQVRVGRLSVVFDRPAGPLSVRVGRWWRPPAPRPAGPSREGRAASARGVAELAALLAGVSGGLPAGAAAPLATAVDDPDRAALVCERLLGLGPGLTPSGDDLLCGALLAVRALGGPDRTDVLAAAVRRARSATTALSAALLEHAARGEGCPQAVGLVEAVTGHRAVAPALAALRAVGHTSGTDLALGVLAGARAVVGPGAARAGAAGAVHREPDR